MAHYLVMLVSSLLAGIVLGLLFYGGLWWTVKRLAVVKHPGLLMSVSLLLRSALTMAGLYLVFDGQVERLLMALVGMLIVRFWLRHRIAAQVGRIDEGVGA